MVDQAIVAGDIADRPTSAVRQDSGVFKRRSECARSRRLQVQVLDSAFGAGEKPIAFVRRQPHLWKKCLHDEDLRR